MINSILPWMLSVGVPALIGTFAMHFGGKFPNQVGIVRTAALLALMFFGIFILGELHASKAIGGLFWHFILFCLFSSASIFVFDKKFKKD